MSETDSFLWDDMISALNGLENALRATADDMVKANAEFAASSGLTAKIVRSTSGECCAWCSSIAGTYAYGSEPKDVYRRHNNCDCTVEYVTSKGSQNVHSKQWTRASEADKIEERKTVGLTSANAAERKDIYLSQIEDDVSIPAGYDGDFSDYDELTLSDDESHSLKELNRLAKENNCEYAQVLSADGKSEIITSGLHGKVDVSVQKELYGSGLTLLHSHTNVTPPSWKDLSHLCDDRVDAIGVIAINGDVYIARIGEGWRTDIEDFEAEVSHIGTEVDKEFAGRAISEGWTPQEAIYMATKEQFFRIARAFGWSMEGGRLG